MREDAEAATGAGLGHAERRSARHAARPLPAPDASRRAAAALERPDGRHEPRRPAAGAARVRQRADAARFPFYGQRHVVKPGLTGWAQVRYTYGASVEDAIEKLQYDLFYIKNLSIALDLFIIF